MPTLTPIGYHGPEVERNCYRRQSSSIGDDVHRPLPLGFVHSEPRLVGGFGRLNMASGPDLGGMYGVRPAPIAESGETIDEAFARFRSRYKEVLFDLAQESRNFDQFKASVERFFYESDEDSEDERSWEEALKAIRDARCARPEPFAKPPREAAESKPSQITVELLNRADARFRPSDNIPDTYSLPMA